MCADARTNAPTASLFRYEYNAVRYAVERMDAAAAAAANGGGGNNGADVELTMVSLGGASLQMASATAVVSATAGMRQVIANDKSAAFKTLLKDAYEYASVDGAAAGVDAAQKVVEEWSAMITAALTVGRQALRQDGSKLSVRNPSVWGMSSSCFCFCFYFCFGLGCFSGTFAALTGGLAFVVARGTWHVMRCEGAHCWYIYHILGSKRLRDC